ncbi:beta-L-arabinofuranosidase domain-containing protein [Cohnella silvisoli]|uniref:Glycoside hydrolase family 127 protein n=1 Tax=Cohnella silvisoli TaxID=2873699 RepID=A0ABV1KRB1_9BACL|nr:beta-L-arabinofuranosidase domain-containing protein [Cohnella silvisoli]MCD9021682.1 glycoside hydrolase family 127 protein [Cohnella silvisoli]
MDPIPYADQKVGGDLYRRAMLNYDRLETEEYRFPTIYREGGYSWPGDWEGRTILALTMLAQATNREPVYLEEIMARLPERLNAQGYFGMIHAQGTVDEQQLSGHSWFLRAMAEYHLWKGDDLSLRIIEDITRHLLLPARGLYEKYPVEPEDRKPSGEAIGSLFERKVGDWLLSTDVGCAFIMLDGATHAYQLLKWPELGALLDEMIGKFRTIDLTGLSFQTHATLSALRGILRHYETTGDDGLLDLARDVFALYNREGITENYANYNWFGRPEWTEPCAVVDSFIVAVELWKHTGEASYLEIAHGILYNGLGYGQRPNGGFGCDCCSGAHDDLLHPKEGLFEAYWCCTMRGGDGLSRAIEYGYFADAERNTVTVPFLRESEAEIRLASGRLTLKQTTAYPIEGSIRLEVADSDIEKTVMVRIFVPSWVARTDLVFRVDGSEIAATIADGFVEWTGTPCVGLTLELRFPIGLRLGNQLNIHSLADRSSLFHGALMLGTEDAGAGLQLDSLDPLNLEHVAGASYVARDRNVSLRPIRDMLELSMEQAVADRRQVLFRME